MSLVEPVPIWSEAPRHCPGRNLPAYRFTPGKNPHPRGQEGGHAYGQAEEIPLYTPPERWRENEFYLHGIDLYHQGYLWESHEAWEALWHLTGKDGAEGQYLQGLIQNAAALLKAHLGQWSGARHLSQEACRRLLLSQKILGPGHQHWMGVEMTAFLESFERCYRDLWSGRDAIGSAPKIILSR